MWKKVIDNNEGDVTIKCKNGEIKGISYILKQNDVMKPIFDGIYNDKSITLFEDFSSEAVKFFLHTFYARTSDIYIEKQNHKLLIYTEFLYIYDIICDDYPYNYNLLMNILNSDDKYLIKDICDILKNNNFVHFSSSTENPTTNTFSLHITQEMCSLPIETYKIFIDFLSEKIKYRFITIKELDIPYDDMLKIIDTIIIKCNYLRMPPSNHTYNFAVEMCSKLNERRLKNPSILDKSNEDEISETLSEKSQISHDYEETDMMVDILANDVKLKQKSNRISFEDGLMEI